MFVHFWVHRRMLLTLQFETNQAENGPQLEISVVGCVRLLDYSSGFGSDVIANLDCLPVYISLSILVSSLLVM